MRSIELQKNGEKSLVAIVKSDGTVQEYVVCSCYDGTKEYGEQWCMGHYFRDLELAVLSLNDRLGALIAKHVYYKGTAYTDNGNYIFSKDACSEELGFFPSRETLKDARGILVNHPGVAEAYIYGHNDGLVLDVTFWDHFCGVEEDY